MCLCNIYLVRELGREFIGSCTLLIAKIFENDFEHLITESECVCVMAMVGGEMVCGRNNHKNTATIFVTVIQ